MKVAARFPVQRFLALLLAIIFVHLLLFSFSLKLIGMSWLQVIVLSLILVSLHFSYQRYQLVTQSPDDLCWNGNSWLMHNDENLKEVLYLTIQPSCWTSSQLCLLCFSSEESDHAWLFSRHQLGRRMYSQLNYLVKQNLKSNMNELD